MKKLAIILLLSTVGFAQNVFPDPTQAQDYIAKRVSSYDRTGGNADMRPMAPGETLTVFDEAGPGVISHIWFTIAAQDPRHLKAMVLRMYWDGETTPSVETPVGDFFCMGWGKYAHVNSLPVCVNPGSGLNSYWLMPFRCV